jgi:hypothetical protein
VLPLLLGVTARGNNEPAHPFSCVLMDICRIPMSEVCGPKDCTQKDFLKYRFSIKEIFKQIDRHPQSGAHTASVKIIYNI